MRTLTQGHNVHFDYQNRRIEKIYPPLREVSLLLVPNLNRRFDSRAPSGRAYEHAEVILSDEQKNFLYGQIEELSKKFSGKIVIQRSAELKIQMERYVSEVNAGGIIRPNGDFRIDCMAPFTIGNVLKETVKNIWLTKGIDAWRSDLVKNFVAAIDEDRQASNYKNHVEADVAL